MSWVPKQLVVVPVDFSDESFEAVKVALDLVDQPDHVIVVHVLAELSPMEPGEIWNSVDAAGRIRHCRKSLQEQLDERGIAGVATEVVIGDAGREVAELAKDVSAELIVLPSHGRTGIKHLLIGSVAERVVRLAHCPVLVLRS